VSGNFDTNFIRDHFTPTTLAPVAPNDATAKVAVALGALLLSDKKPKPAAAAETAGADVSGWKRNRSGGR
jgi:hypothetical protein